MQSFQFNQPQTQGFGTGATNTGFGGGGGFGSFSQQTAAPTFGTSFSSPATSAAPAFGSGGTNFSSFGTNTFQTPQTGTTFGTPQQAATPFGSTGTTFGAATQPQAGFGAAAQQPTFGVAQSTTSLFGTTQTQPSSGFGSTGTGTFGTQPTSGFGSGLGTSTFGTNQPSLFGTSQASTGFGTVQPNTFGTTQAGSWLSGTSQPSLFGSSGTSVGFGGTTGGLFSQPKPGLSFSSFGQPQQQQLSLFGNPAQQQQQQQVAPAIDEQLAFHQSMFACCKFGDERDAILANLNYIQASWGTGKGFYNQTFPPINYTDKNVFYRFKAVGYSFMYTDSNEDGQVVIRIKKPHAKVTEEETQLINSLQAMIQKPNIFFKISASKALNEGMTVIILTADDRMSLRRVLATDLAGALLQPHLKVQLDSLSIIDICPKVKPSPEQLKAYLESPPAGLDPRIWKKAQDDNPDPNNMIPIPLLGSEALSSRLEAQMKETQQHQERLILISEEIKNLQAWHSTVESGIAQLRRRHIVLSHRIIASILRLQILHKQGTGVQPEEENLRKQFEELAKQLNSPKHFRGRLNELMSHVRLHKSTMEARGNAKYSIDPNTLDQIREFLNIQQDSVKHLVDTLKADLEYAHQMSEELTLLPDSKLS